MISSLIKVEKVRKDLLLIIDKIKVVILIRDPHKTFKLFVKENEKACLRLLSDVGKKEAIKRSNIGVTHINTRLDVCVYETPF